MINHFANAVDALDAAVFSGDGLVDVENQRLLKRHLERWDRELESMIKTFPFGCPEEDDDE